jgi:tetrahydromethanopterin S-methyltransferase subunit F
MRDIFQRVGMKVKEFLESTIAVTIGIAIGMVVAKCLIYLIEFLESVWN